MIGIAVGLFGGWLHRVVPRGVTARYEGIYAVGFGLAAFGLADVTFGNGLIAAFVFGITLGISEHEITERFAVFSENVSAIFQVLTFFVFGALIVATGFDGRDRRARGLHRLRPARRAPGRRRAGASSAPRSPARTRRSSPGSAPRASPRCCSRCWCSTRRCRTATLVFDVASFVILASIVAHGLTDTVGAGWIAKRMERSVSPAIDLARDRGGRHPPGRGGRGGRGRGAGDVHEPALLRGARAGPGPPLSLHPPASSPACIGSRRISVPSSRGSTGGSSPPPTTSSAAPASRARSTSPARCRCWRWPARGRG